ncbi:MAG: gamma-glutamyl-gamma-aminobutyrate hydrolase family protein [Ruminiclostridium sp.]
MKDGLTEAICKPDLHFLWAVQWHPEFSYKTDSYSRAIFSAFVDSMK